VVQRKDAFSANKQYTAIDRQAASFITHPSSLANKEGLKADHAIVTPWLQRSMMSTALNAVHYKHFRSSWVGCAADVSKGGGRIARREMYGQCHAISDR
jgi:hypothetical protein